MLDAIVYIYKSFIKHLFFDPVFLMYAIFAVPGLIIPFIAYLELKQISDRVWDRNRKEKLTEEERSQYIQSILISPFVFLWFLWSVLWCLGMVQQVILPVLGDTIEYFVNH